MRVLVTFAVEAEFRPWRKLRRFVETRHGPSLIRSTQLGDLGVEVLLTGIGGKSAWLQTAKRVWNGDIDICISSGLAGALRPEYRVGQVVAAKAVHRGAWSETTPADPALLRRAVEGGAQEVGSFYTASHVVVLAREKRELGKGSDVVEMESGEVLREAAAFGARVIAIRAISDGVDEDMPLDFNRVTTPSGGVSLARVVGEAARHFRSIPSLLRFGQQSKLAAETLAEFLDAYVETLAGECRVPATEAVGR